MGKQQKGQQSDDALLDSRIKSYKIDKPPLSLFTIGFVASFIPAYVFHAIQNLPWDDVMNLPLFVVIPFATAFMLSRAYSEMYETEFLKRHRHYEETRSAEDGDILKSLRLQCALGWTVFFCNALFIALSVFLQLYIFRNLDTRISFIVSPLLAAGVTMFIAIKNE
jgi:hypothetical protein